MGLQLVSLTYLYPISDSLVGADWTGTYADIDDLYGAWDSGATNNRYNGTGPSSRRCGMTQMSGATSISNVRLGVRVERSGGTWMGQAFRPYLYIGGVAYYYDASWQVAPFGYTFFQGDYGVNPATSAAWTQSAVNALLASIEGKDSTSIMRLDALWLEISFVGAPQQVEPVRDVASRRLFSFRQPRSVLPGLVVPLDVGLDVSPMTALPIVHFAGPHSTDQGWLQKPWQARPGLVREITILGDGSGCRLNVIDRRQRLVLYRDNAWSRISSSPITADGIARISKGVGRAYIRPSVAWVKDPTSGMYRAVEADQEQLGDTGELFEAYAENVVQYSGFQAGDITGWTKSGTGVNGSAIIADTNDVQLYGYAMWDRSSTGVDRSAYFLAGSPHTTDLKLTSTVSSSIAANSIMFLSIWTRNDGGAAQSGWYALQRGVDSKYWRAFDDTWHVGIEWNEIDTNGGVAEVQRWDAGPITAGASATTLTLICGLPSTVPAGQVTHFYGAQITGQNPSSPILTTNATRARYASQLLITNDVGKRCINTDQGGFCCEVIPQWSSAYIGNVNKTILYIALDSSNYMWLYYDGTNGRWAFEVKHNSVTDRAVQSGSVTAGTTYRVGARWTGSNGELDLTAYTYSIFVDGVKGTDDVGGAISGVLDDCDLEIGTRNTTENFDGVIRLHTSLQWVPTDVEMARLP